MKIKGAELIQFLAEAWPGPEDDWYWNHDLFDEPDPAATYDTDEIGGIFYQGRGTDPTDGGGYDLAALIRKWRKEKSFDVLIVTVKKPQTDAVIKQLKAMGLKVTK